MTSVVGPSTNKVVSLTISEYMDRYAVPERILQELDEEMVHGIDCKHGLYMLKRLNKREVISEVHLFTRLEGSLLDGLYVYDEDGKLLYHFRDFSLVAGDSTKEKYQKVITAAGIRIKEWNTVRGEAQGHNCEHVFIVMKDRG